MKGKKGQMDMEVLMSPGFVILFLMAAGATIIGWIAGKRMGFGGLPFWQIAITIVVEAVAAYIIVLRSQ